MFGKVVGSVLGASIAERSGKAGALGGAAGLVVSRLVRRSPLTALLVGGAWLGHKLYRRNQEREAKAAAATAEPNTPAPPKAPDVPLPPGT